jgi:hypothetical protein
MIVNRQKRDLKRRFELTCNIFTDLIENPDLVKMMATTHSYSGFIKQNLEQAGPIDGPTFANWMESAERHPEEFPEPWVADLLEMFDELLVNAATEENIQPPIIADALHEWAKESQEEAEQIHDLPEGFFDA